MVLLTLNTTKSEPPFPVNGEANMEAIAEHYNNSDADSDDDYDKYRMEVNEEKPRKISEKRRADHLAFASWIESNHDTVIKGGKMATSSQPDHLSVAHLIKETESKKIIASPREYQIELFERARDRNTITVLETGAGKTLIAALLLRHILEQELESRAAGQPKKIAFFLVIFHTFGH